MRGLKGKVVVIAGGGSGIGAATAVRLAEEGARMVLGDLSADNAASVAATIATRGGDCTPVQFDITQPDSVDKLVSVAEAQYGQIDAVHVNAADLSPTTIGRDTDALDIDPSIFDRTVAVNLRGHLLVTKRALPALLDSEGVLVYTSSAAAFVGDEARPAYSMSKSGLNALVRHVATRWGRQGVRANAVAPGMVLTATILQGAQPELREYALAVGRSPRLGTPEDIAAAVAFLMSSDAEWINGQILSVDGGTTMR
jgi:NAD(P)-dependent dehydrogenase (short-subunit alcohol dehydrogenase family)